MLSAIPTFIPSSRSEPSAAPSPAKPGPTIRSRRRRVNPMPLSGEPAESQFRGGEVFECGADRFEQRDLVCGASAFAGAACEAEQIAGDAVRCEQAGFQRLDDVAGL